MRSIEASLNEILAFRLGYERLELCGRERIYETGFGNDEKQDLSACQGRQLIRLE